MKNVYTFAIRPFMFRMDPERAHNLAIGACKIGGRSRILRDVVRSQLSFEDPRLEQTICGVRFSNPIGLGAGFDKNGYAVGMLGSLGFGHVEIGSVSAYPSNGNPRPRLFRIPKDEGIVVHYGVPNEGADIIGARLKATTCWAPVGVNLVKTNDHSHGASDAAVIEDLATSFSKLQTCGSYININMSCPNCPGDRDFFADIAKIDALLQRLSRIPPKVPVFLKLKPTSDRALLNEIVAVSDRYPYIAGFAMNLPPGRPAELKFATAREVLDLYPGSVSGRPVEAMANANLSLLYEAIGRNSRFKLMSSGGVFSAEDAYRKIRLGASLVQIYTAMVYYGPTVVRHIVQGLSNLMKRDGFTQLADVVGIDARGDQVSHAVGAEARLVR